MHLKLLYISQASFEHVGTHIPIDILSLFFDTIAYRFPWWSLKINYRIQKIRHFKIIVDLEDNRLLGNLYEPGDDLSTAITFVNMGLLNDIQIVDIDMDMIDSQFLSLWKTDDGYEYEFCESAKDARKLTMSQHTDFFYCTNFDLSEFTVGTFTENAGKARNVLSTEKCVVNGRYL